MFKVFLTFLIFFACAGNAAAQSQTAFKESEGEQENALSKYINASAVCAKMTDPSALYERGMLLISDANADAYMAAADCFTSAAMRNHTPSQLELGKLYESGNGVSQSRIFAYKWYQTAVLLGNQDAIPFRNKLESRMTLDEISLANPMIQSTLNLIELFNKRQEAELDELEKKINQQYKDFGVDITQYEEKVETKTVYDNPLIEALIRDQQKKEMKNKEDEQGGRRRRRRKNNEDNGEQNDSRRREPRDNPESAEPPPPEEMFQELNRKMSEGM